MSWARVGLEPLAWMVQHAALLELLSHVFHDALAKSARAFILRLGPIPAAQPAGKPALNLGPEDRYVPEGVERMW